MIALPDDLAADLAAALASTAEAEAPWVFARVYERQLAASGRRRAAGAYYTPPHLIDFVVDRTLGPLVDAAADPLALRVIDPACGAGVFLLAALDRICARVGADRAADVARRCLYGVDIDPIAVELARRAVRRACGAEPNLAVANAVIGAFPFAGRFDAVIGNPPWGQKGFRWSPADKAWARAHYRCGKGVLDPYALFVERATELAGRWGMVLPDVLLLKNQQDIRDVILERCAIEWIADAGQAFAGAAIDVVCVVARAGPARDHAVRVWLSLPADWRQAPPPERRVPQAWFAELPGHKFNIRLTEPARALWRRLDRLPRFGDRFEVHEGVHTGNVRAKLFVAARANRHCVPVLVGRGELAPGRIAWAGRWLDRSPGRIDRGAGEYASLGRPEWFEQAKLLVRRTGDRVVAAYDGDGYYCSNNMFVAIPRAPMAEEAMRAHEAILNSRLMTWFFRTVQPRAGRVFPELKIHHLAAFPVPREIDGVAAAAAAGADVDAAVERAFGLTAAERALVRAGA